MGINCPLQELLSPYTYYITGLHFISNFRYPKGGAEEFCNSQRVSLRVPLLQEREQWRHSIQFRYILHRRNTTNRSGIQAHTLTLGGEYGVLMREGELFNKGVYLQ